MGHFTTPEPQGDFGLITFVEELDQVAAQLRRTRADVVRQAVEYYLDDYEDLSRAVEVLRDPADPVLDWEAVKRDLLR